MRVQDEKKESEPLFFRIWRSGRRSAFVCRFRRLVVSEFSAVRTTISDGLESPVCRTQFAFTMYSSSTTFLPSCILVAFAS